MNRDQIIIKPIQNTMKMLLKNRKNIENHHCGGGPKAKNGPRPTRRAPPPRPGRSVGLGRDFGPPRGSLLGQIRPDWRRLLLAVGSDPTAGRIPRGIKTRPVPATPPKTLEHFFPSPFSLHDGGGGHWRRRPRRPRRRRGWRRHRPPRRRARSAHAGARRRRVAWRRCPEPARARTSGVPDGERRSPSGPRPSERRRGTFPRGGGRRCWRRTVSTRRPLL